MLTRLIAATALPLLLAAPAFADCSQELANVEQAVVSAETGAGGSKAGVPVTEHQEEVMGGKQKKSTGAEITGSTGTQTETTTPHQEQVTGTRPADSANQPAELLAEARKMAAAGDEQGCMKKLADIKDLIGTK
ncbi:hypothetical protein [Sinorhizobium saheli]|uniref:Uncharacterized protein n=1 Tax=Sinorhizobium saheli TaxID=36856 RepID=A0A178XL50_SINSA|nr:hypothetical protein [Sinorhizobium saheli]MQW87257.1 hypothetical protein [Sinorhizobium saheli]OAP35934.1 hypothetical protein ATB98_09860 [Sinorhizobium saheli]